MVAGIGGMVVAPGVMGPAPIFSSLAPNNRQLPARGLPVRAVDAHRGWFVCFIVFQPLGRPRVDIREYGHSAHRSESKYSH